jgi:hypothetical protein
MRCPKCNAAIPRTAMFFSTALHSFDCENCGATLQASYLSRLALGAVSLLASIGVAEGVRGLGVSRALVALALGVTFLAVFFVGARWVPRLRVQGPGRSRSA